MFMLLRSCQLDCIFMQFMFEYASVRITPYTILFGCRNCKFNNIFFCFRCNQRLFRSAYRNVFCISWTLYDGSYYTCTSRGTHMAIFRLKSGNTLVNEFVIKVDKFCQKAKNRNESRLLFCNKVLFT